VDFVLEQYVITGSDRMVAGQMELPTQHKPSRNRLMSSNIVHNNSINPFESIRREDTDGEYWSARELMPLLGYPRWNEFVDTIERGKAACQNSENSVLQHFSGLTLKSQGRPKEDYRLSRLASYLTAMNGDPRKPEVAAAQSYFAIKTREAEVVIPQQQDKLAELRMCNENLKMQLQWASVQDTRIAIHGLPVALMLEGKSDAVIEVDRPTIEVIDQNSKAIFKGQTTKQLADYCNKKMGTRYKSGAEVARKLKAAGRQDLIATTPRAVLQDYVPIENLHEAINVLAAGDRQKLVGE
jgi:hypothetical protein